MYSRDVPIIAQVTGNKELLSSVDDVLAAISQVRGAHLRVSHQLARQVMARAAALLRRPGRRSELIEIEEGVVVARVLEIESEATLVRESLANHLLEDRWRQYSAAI
jgi:hypothetical protein